MATDLTRISEKARGEPALVFTSLYHHVCDEDNLRVCYGTLGANKAPGVDGVTKREYGENLDGNLRDLSARLKRMGYRPGTKRRSYIPKAGQAKGRPLGISNFEDKISCKGRWFCPSCHQKKVQLFGALLAESILYPVPHRHYTLGIPKMLRPYFRYNRDLLKELCRIARDCLIDYQRAALQLPEGIPGAVMAIHTFGEYLDFHPHLHALVADGLFMRGGWFHVLPKTGSRPLEELFRARTIAFLLKEGLLPPERARMLLSWKHSGFCVHRSKRVQPHQKEDLERLAQYIIRNPFAIEKMHPDPDSGTIIYRSGMNPKIKRNFEIFTPCDFIAAITQHIPEKRFQLVRYYGWYSNKMRGQRNKLAESRDGAGRPPGNEVEIIDVSEHRSRRPPSPKWRELIKKVWEADPLICPTCSREMRIVALIDERAVIERILRHLGLWEEGVRLHPARAPPKGEGPLELFPGDPFPDYSGEPVMEYDLCADA